MTSHFTQQELDAVLGTLLETAKRNQTAASNAVIHINQAANALKQSAITLPIEVTKSANEAINRSLANATEQLVVSFVQADTSAQVAAKAYEKAAKFAMGKVIGLGLAINVVLLFISWMYLTIMRDEMAELRAQKVQIEAELAVLVAEKQKHQAPRKKQSK